MIKSAVRLAMTILVGATVCGAPVFAQRHHHGQTTSSLSLHDSHALPTHLVLYAGACPQFGDNNVRWINLHGHHALSVASDLSGDSGFEVFVATGNGRLPTNTPPVMPEGTIRFRVSNTSPTPFYVEVYNYNGFCDTVIDSISVSNNGIVSFPVGPETVGAYVYLDNSGDSSAILSEFTFNGHALILSPSVDTSEQPSFRFCGTALGVCAN